jgi:hypothetical protein
MLNLREMFPEVLGQRIRKERVSIFDAAVRIVADADEAEDGIPLGVETVIGKAVRDKEGDKKEAGETCGQAENIDGRGKAVFCQGTEGGLEVIFKHDKAPFCVEKDVIGDGLGGVVCDPEKGRETAAGEADAGVFLGVILGDGEKLFVECQAGEDGKEGARRGMWCGVGGGREDGFMM